MYVSVCGHSMQYIKNVRSLLIRAYELNHLLIITNHPSFGRFIEKHTKIKYMFVLIRKFLRVLFSWKISKIKYENVNAKHENV